MTEFDLIRTQYEMRKDDEKPVGRFAPSPTGLMHMGNAWAGLMAWLAVRKSGGTMILRMEDLDPQRSKPEFTQRIMEDLKWLGLDWDEGPDCDGRFGPYSQDDRRGVYDAALLHLREKGLLYPCFCTRRELREASAPHREDGQYIYSGRCFTMENEARLQRMKTDRYAWRVHVGDSTESFEDLKYGYQSQMLGKDCGDFILARTDGVHSYQLAVVVDDALMGVDLVVRGADLLDSAPRQIFLHKALGFEAPVFGHVPLLLGENADRLSKRHGALDLGKLRALGWTPERVVGLLAYKAGLIEKNEPISARDLIPYFEWSRIPAADVTLFERELK